MRHYSDNHTNVGVSFPVNPPGAAIGIALAKHDGQFVVTALSTDGGAIPRNLTLKQGLALVDFGALSMTTLCGRPAYTQRACLASNAKVISLREPMQTSPSWIVQRGRQCG